MIKDETNVDVEHSMSLAPPGRLGTVIDKIQNV
jgi:hypothetical protein